MNKPHFNLIDEKWIPVGGEGLVSLQDIFSRQDFTELGGNPVQKISLLKLLLAIAQAACTPSDNQEWRQLTPERLGENCQTYLEKWRDSFWLYGARPFLQMPGVAKAKTIQLGALQPHISTGNTTILFDEQQVAPLSDSEKALLVLSTIGFGLGGKKTDNKVVLSPGYTLKVNEKGKEGTGKVGANLGFMGYLHHFLMGSSILETLHFNLFTQNDMQEMHVFPKGIGRPPWEQMPEGEDCAIAKDLRHSLMGRLVPLSKFMLLGATEVHYSDGVIYPGHLEGGINPSVAYNYSGKKVVVLWVNPEKQPWRDLVAILSFIIERQDFFCQQLYYPLSRLKLSDYQEFGIWAGGLKVSSNAGEQYVSGTDDFVESSVIMSADYFDSARFQALKTEMEILERFSKSVYGSVLRYYKEQKFEGAEYAKKASNIFWQLCETQFQDLLNACANNQEQSLRLVFARFAKQAYDKICPKDTAKQIASWAEHQPRLGKYLN